MYPYSWLELSQYGITLLLMLAGVGIAVGLVTLARILSPHNPTPEKQLSYECGEDPIGNAWLRFNIRFYIVALIFVIFDVEMVLIYPVAAIFKGVTDSGNFQAAAMVFGELFFFIGVLFLGLVYVWKKGDLGWIRTFRVPGEPGLRSWPKTVTAPVAPSAAQAGEQKA